MKKKVIFFLIIYLPVIIFASQGVEQIINIDENIEFVSNDHFIKIHRFKITDNYYTLTIYFSNHSSKKYKILFNIDIMGTEYNNDFICTYVYSAKDRNYSKRGSIKENLLFSNFYKEPFLLLKPSANSTDNIYSNFRANLKIPRTATSIIFSGWVDTTEGKDYSKTDFYHIFNFTDYDTILKSNLSNISFDNNSPKISIISPKYEDDFLRTDEFSSIIKGIAIDDKGIFQVYINKEIATLQSNGQFQKRIKLKIGKNPIIIKAVDINDNETIKEFLIIRDEIIEEEDFSDIDFALETSNNKPNAIAVVFGIEEYQYAPSVTNAYNDAEIMREYLISTFGLKRKNIYFRYNERATKGEFDKVFSENGWIAKNADENSEIYVFYAGHGVASTDDKSTYLIPNDIDPNYASTGYSLNELYQNLSKIKSKSTIIILDACFSGVSRENEMLLADSRPISIEVKRGSIPKNLNVFTASSGNEISSGFSQKMHGLFTYFFLKGLNKNADLNNDKKITYGEMEQYLKENVSSQARKMGREQNPQLHTSDKDKILLKY